MDHEIVATVDYAKPLQHEDELTSLIDLLMKEGVRSYLEVGARYGGTFERVMMSLPLSSRGVAVDFPGGAFGDDNSAPILLAALKRLRSFGRDVKSILGPSSAHEVYERAEAMGPYDAVLIDADHSYAAVKEDFFLYSRMARKMVILHDIAAPESVHSRDGLPVEVPRFWNNVKCHWPSKEIIRSGSLMGFGILYMQTVDA